MTGTGTRTRSGGALALGLALVVAALLLGPGKDFFNYEERRAVIIRAEILNPDGGFYEDGMELWGDVHWSVEGADIIDKWPAGKGEAHSIWQRVRRPYHGGNVSARFQVRLRVGYKLYVAISSLDPPIRKECTSRPQPTIGQIDLTCSWSPGDK